jgi:hypothetical protein
MTTAIASAVIVALAVLRERISNAGWSIRDRRA